MLTRCPGCATAFRLHPEQLKARQGKVRCGQCHRVFNALDSLLEELVVAPPAVANEVGAAAVVAPEASTTSTVPAPYPATVIASAMASDAAMSAVSPAPTSGMVPDVETDVEADVLARAPDEAPEPIDSGEVFPAQGESDISSPSTPAQPVKNIALPGAVEAADPDLLEIEVTEPSRLIWFWASGIVLAIVALILQGAMHFRVEAATLLPESRPYFLAACELLKCRLDLPRKVELLTIEGSDLHPDPTFSGNTGRLGLKVNILNRAPFAQAWPALELTLTDTNDQPILRRVLNASDYLVARSPIATVLEQGIGARQDVSIELALDTGDLVASGYRLYLFFH